MFHASASHSDMLPNIDGRVDAGEAAALDLLRELDGEAAAAGDGDQGDGGEGHGNSLLNCIVLLILLGDRARCHCEERSDEAVRRA